MIRTIHIYQCYVCRRRHAGVRSEGVQDDDACERVCRVRDTATAVAIRGDISNSINTTIQVNVRLNKAGLQWPVPDSEHRNNINQVETSQRQININCSVSFPSVFLIRDPPSVVHHIDATIKDRLEATRWADMALIQSGPAAAGGDEAGEPGTLPRIGSRTFRISDTASQVRARPGRRRSEGRALPKKKMPSF